MPQLDDLYQQLWVRWPDGPQHCLVCGHEAGCGHEPGCAVGQLESLLNPPKQVEGEDQRVELARWNAIKDERIEALTAAIDGALEAMRDTKIATAHDILYKARYPRPKK